ncbi:MAG: arabinosyltransferase domain-containing protein, partial [Pseudonocardiaceae bacterium]
LLALGLAALVAAGTVAVAPTGLLAMVPVVLSMPGRLLRENACRREIVARVALLGSIAATAITIMFADQSWHGVAVATDIHRYIGPDRPWFDEGQRYAALLGADSWGSAGKRLPVLLTLALMLPVLALLARHGSAVLERRGQLVLLTGAPVGLALLALTPSKWTHHFGALSGLGPAFLIASVAVGITAARNRPRDPATLAVGLGGGVLVALAAGVSFAGPNTWWGYSDFGMLFSDGPLWPLHNPLVWLAVAGAMAALRTLWRRRSGGAGVKGAGLGGAGLGRIAAAPALLAVLAAATSVALLLATFLAAPLRRADGYSLPAQNLADLRGTSCGIEEHVQVLHDYPEGVLAPTQGVDVLDSFVAQGGYPEAMTPPQPGGRFVWGSATGGPLSTGTLRTSWFALPPLPADQELAVSVAGRLGAEDDGGNTVALEFGRNTPGGVVESLGRRQLADPEPAEHAYAPDDRRRRQAREREQAPPSWRTRGVASDAVPSGAELVRVLVVDGSVGAPGWIAVTGPRRISVVGLRGFLDARTPVLVDWPIAFVVPCRREVPTVADGLAQAPTAILAVPASPHPVRDLWSSGGAQLAYATADAGSFAGVPQVGQVTTLESRLVGDEGRYWGSVQMIDYGMARDAYDTRTVHRWLPGWVGDDPYPFD